MSVDAEIRSAAFSWLSEQAARYGNAVPTEALRAGLTYRGERVTLMGPESVGVSFMG